MTNLIRLEVLSGVAKGNTVELGKPLVQIGRAPENDLLLDEAHVSSLHATLALEEDGYVLKDLNSTNGTHLVRDGKRHLVDAERLDGLAVQSGDEIWFGRIDEPTRVLVQIEEAAEGPNIVSLRRLGDIPAVEAQVGSDRAALKQLYDAQQRIAAPNELPQVIDQVAEQIFGFLGQATHVTVVLRTEESGASGDSEASRYLPVGSRVRGGSGRAETIPVARSVFKKVLAERAAVLAADARRDLAASASVMAAHILSTIALPLWQGDEIIGVLQVDNRDASGVFKEADLDLLSVLAQSASQAFERARLVQRLRVKEEQQRTENRFLKDREQQRRFAEMIGESQTMLTLAEQIRKVVDTRVSVLIEGETGTGKELVASALHYLSGRHQKLFVAQNCAALPENLLESELFGHKKGAFTGATEEKKGLFELAHGGTLFLDEIAELPLNLQAKLLRVLQEGELRPVGATQVKRVDVRVVAATNRNLEREVQEGRFREDLFYRLRVFPLDVPPLRDRRGDVARLAEHFLARYSLEFGKSVAGFAQPAMELLAAYAWPGNVRELQNEIQRLVIQVDPGQFVQARDVSARVRSGEGPAGALAVAGTDTGTLKQRIERVERRILERELSKHDNNKSATAKTLGMTREGLHKKLKSYGMT